MRKTFFHGFEEAGSMESVGLSFVLANDPTIEFKTLVRCID